MKKVSYFTLARPWEHLFYRHVPGSAEVRSGLFSQPFFVLKADRMNLTIPGTISYNPGSQYSVRKKCAGFKGIPKLRLSINGSSCRFSGCILTASEKNIQDSERE